MTKLNTKTYFALKYPGPDDTPGKTYYYRRSDGSIFACGPKEASLIHSKYTQVGVSSAKTYLAIILEAVRVQDADIEACNEEKENALEECATKEERIEVLKWYRTERQRISDASRAALDRAREEDIKEAMSNHERPADMNGTVHGNTNPKIDGMIKRMVGKL